MSGIAAVIGSAATGLSNIYSNRKSFEYQRALNKQKYTDMISFAQKYGATPSAVIQGITGSAGGAVPTASSSNNPMPDLGQSLSSMVSAGAAQRQAGAAEDQAKAALTTAETERQLGLMKLRWEPEKYFADIRKSLAQAFESSKNAFLHGSMRQYYDELTKDVQQVRPWKIAGLRQSLLNDMATFGKILQETKTSKAQENYFGAAAYEARTQGGLNEALENKAWTETLNESLKGFRLQWENSLLSYGIDPTKGFWENTGRLMYTHPNLFRQRMDMFISGLNAIDNKLQMNLGEHYKRNAAIGYGLYKLNQLYNKNANSRSYRNSNAARVISSFIPFLGGSSVPSVGVSGPGVDWWLKD